MSKKRFLRLRLEKMYDGFYKNKFHWMDRCVYCGLNATQKDHVFPISKMAIYAQSERFMKIFKKAMVKVPCCSSCNAIAGDNVFASVLQKRDYIKSVLRRKFHKKLRTVKWDDEEMSDLGHTMKGHVLKMLREREFAEQRVMWPHNRKIWK